MRLKGKILVGYGVAFALMGLTVAWSVANLVFLGKATDAILSENYRSIIAAENMVDALERQDSGILLVFLGDLEKGVSQFRENEAVFFKWMARAKDNITISGEGELLQGIENAYSAYRHKFSTLTDMRDATLQNLRPIDYQEMIFPLFAKVREECIGLRHLNEQTMHAASVRAGQVAERAIWSTILVAGSALIVALGFSLFISERIVQPIRRFMDASQKISAGDYTVQVTIETGDELGRLAVEFNQMVTQLSRYHEINIEQIVSEKTKGEAILACIEDGLVVFDTSLKVTDINTAAHKMLELPFTNTSQLTCEDILPAVDVCEMIQKTAESGIPPDVPDEQRIISLPGRGQPRQYLFSATPIRGKGRGLLGVVLLLKDVTRLREVERLKSEFVMAASHELRTPLTSLAMSVDLLLEHDLHLPPKEEELLQSAQEEVHRMKALVNELLDLSKIEAGKIELEFEKVPVATLFDHAMSVFKSQVAKKEITLSLQLSEKLPSVRADANKVTWVLTNLISNSLRYVGNGGHIQLIAQQIGPQVHLTVKDDGPGIPPEYQSKIFQKFVQVKGRETGGTGLGLAICKEIVRAHGGAIWVESSHGRGSTFTFTLPAAQ